MGRKTSEADRYVKKRKAFEERDERAAAVKKAEDDEVAEEVRGLPLKDRLQYAFEEAEEGEEEEGGEQTYIDDSDNSGDIDAKIIQGWESDKMSSPVPTTDVDSEIDRGAMQDCVGAHRLRTAWCSGDAWAGLFFDVEAKDKGVRVKALAVASHLYRREKHVCINVFARNTSSLGHEGAAAGWQLVLSLANCSLPMVGKRTEGETDEPYAQCVLEEEVLIPAGGTAGFALYTNSLCGLALRWPSQGITRTAKSAGDVDFLGLEIGNATSGIVADAQDARRNVNGGVSLGEVTDADQHIRIRAGYCSPVTGQDHPFEEADLERDPENVRAFVGEVIYDLATLQDPAAASPKPKKKKRQKDGEA